MRLDLDGPPHRNPDDQEIPCPHLHIYRAGYGDSGPSPPRPTDTLMCKTCFPHSRRSCAIAISRTSRELRRGFSHDRSRDRKTSERLPRLAQR
jgi:hypothetical protein